MNPRSWNGMKWNGMKWNGMRWDCWLRLSWNTNWGALSGRFLDHTLHGGCGFFFHRAHVINTLVSICVLDLFPLPKPKVPTLLYLSWANTVGTFNSIHPNNPTLTSRMSLDNNLESSPMHTELWQIQFDILHRCLRTQETRSVWPWCVVCRFLPFQSYQSY